MMWSVLDEARKHRAFREVRVGYILGAIFLLFYFYQSEPIATPTHFLRWYTVQQDIYVFGATLTAFLLAIGLSRLVCYEHERGTDSLIRTSDIGCFYTWKSKVMFTIVYCAVVVSVIGVASLLVSCGSFGFEGALSPVEACGYFRDEALPPMSNIAYCVLQYVFLFFGALYFAGFVLLVAALTKRTALTIFLCGGSYLVCVVYAYVGYMLPRIVHNIVGFFYRFSFGGYLLQESYSWSSFGQGFWTDVWKPILLVVVMIILEFSGLWLIWRRKARK